MKRFTTSLLLIGAAGFTTAAVADMGDWSPYVGLGYKYQNAKGNGDWKDAVGKNFHNLGFFVGSKFHENFSAEVGYSRSNNKSKTTTVAAAGTLLGVAGASTVKTKTRLETWHLDVMGHMPMDQNWNLMGILGLAWGKAKVQDDGTTGALQATIRGVSSSRKMYPRVGVGAEWQEDQWGARAKLLWENTSSLRVKNVSGHEKSHKSGFSFGVGAYWKFM